MHGLPLRRLMINAMGHRTIGRKKCFQGTPRYLQSMKQLPKHMLKGTTAESTKAKYSPERRGFCFFRD